MAARTQYLQGNKIDKTRQRKGSGKERFARIGLGEKEGAERRRA